MRASLVTFCFLCLSLPAYAVLPGQEGRYVGTATVRYTDLGAAKSRSYKTSAILTIQSNGNGELQGTDINHKISIQTGTYHGVGNFVDGLRIGNMPLHFGSNGSIKGTFHFASPGQNEMFEGKLSLKKQQ